MARRRALRDYAWSGVAILMFAVLFGLTTDYQVFLVNWRLPGFLDRWVPRLNLEGDAREGGDDPAGEITAGELGAPASSASP